MTRVRGYTRSNGLFRRRTYVRPHERRSRRTDQTIAILAAVIGLIILWIVLAH